LISSLLLLSSVLAFPQKVSPRLAQPIDESKRFSVAGNTRPEAKASNDRGAVVDHFALEHMFLQLRRSPDQEKTLETFIDQLHDPKSPNFHQWITAQEFGEKYGLAQEDLAIITGWLESHGFTVGAVYPNRMVIDFSGTAGQVRQTFHTEIHHLEVNGIEHIANMSDPQIPAALVPAVAGIVSLHDFRPQPMQRAVPAYSAGSGIYSVVPADLYTIYNFNPMFAAGYSGQGQTIVVIEDSDVYSTNDWNVFRSTFGLASTYPQGSFTQVHPARSGTNNCSDPGVNSNDKEAILDAEWASAAAPNAAIQVASCADKTTTFGGFIALQNLLNASGTPPAIVSISYLTSETEEGATSNAAINSLYQQAVTAGVSVFVCTGDQLAAMSDDGNSYATHGININALGSTAYNVAVGGTDFGDTYAGTTGTYWSATNGATYGSALSYIPEIPWNDSCASVLLANYYGFNTTYGTNGFCNSSAASNNGFLRVDGGSGGPRACATGSPSTPGVVSGTCAGYPKPSWQSVFGNPKDGVRDLPDVSLFAANSRTSGHCYVICYSDTANGGVACTGNPSGWYCRGGTSYGAPIMAGVQALINQYTGSRSGNPNPTYYSLARAEYGSSGSSSCNSSNGNRVGGNCIFYDVTQGDIDAPCQGALNCYLPSGTYGVLSTSTSSYQPAYTATSGWDFTSGIGTINVYNLVRNFNSNPANYTLMVSVAGSGTVTSSPTGINCSSGSGACATNFFSGISVTLTATPASGFTFAGWSGGGCSGTGTCVVTLNAATTVTATFNSVTSTYTLTVTDAGKGTGTVTSSPAGISCGSTCSASYSPGTSITLTAVPVSGSSFAGWSGACSGTGACSLSMNANQNVIATFTCTICSPRVLTLPASGVSATSATLEGTVNPSGAGATYWFEYGTRESRATITKTQSPTLSASTTESKVTAAVNGLAPHTVYYFRIVAQNSVGTSHGQILEVHTGEPTISSGRTSSSPMDSVEAQPVASSGPSTGSTLPQVTTSSIKATTTVNTQTAMLEVTAGQNKPLVVSLAGFPLRTPITATCADLPEGVTCSYDDKKQTVTITAAAETPTGSYPVRVMFSTGEGVNGEN
jgi:hypothetical protein